MLINNTEALKGWLVVVLEPLCDADSSALARYVLALLKKDKPERELKRVMIEQLDVFLAEETKPFVERLFAAIGTEEYLKVPQIAPPKKLNDIKKTTTTSNDITTTVASTVEANDTHVVQSVDNVKNVIKQENGEALNYTDASKVRNVTSATAERDFADKNHTPPIEDNKAKDIRNDSSARIAAERTLSPSHRQSTPSQQQLQPPGHYHHHHSGSTKCTAPSQVYGNTGGGDRHQQHRSASPPPMARASVADKENQPRESRRRRASLRSRSRSRSNERLSRRSRSRDRRVNDREKSQRQFRNKSPPNGSGGGSGDNRHDRRRGGGNRRMVVANTVAGNSNIDDRSPRLGNDRKTGGLGSGASGRSVNRSSNSPSSRSPSQERANRNKRSPSVGRNQLKPPFTNVSGSPGVRHHHHHENSKRQRCRDFDEKGYCVRGETCPWDHGVNPVVFEGLNNSALISMSLREYNPDAPDLWSRTAPPPAAVVAGAPGGPLMTGPVASAINPFTGSARPGAVMLGAHTGHIGFPQVPGTEKSSPTTAALSAADYARTAASAFRTAAPMIPFPFNPNAVATPLQRELIPIPVVDATGCGGNSVGGDVAVSMQGANKRRYELEDSVAIAEGPSKRKIPAHSRLGPRLPSMQNCSLELRKIPRGLNTIAHLNNHFAKFGKIVNIQISYDNDPEAAIVTFSAHAEANVAYRSTEAVLNNRFIKVFWHSTPSPDTSVILGGDGNTILGGGHNPIMGGVRKNSQYHLNNVPAVMPIPTADSAKIANTTSQSQAGDANNNSNAVPSSSTTANSSNVAPQDSTSSSTIASTSNVSTTTTTTTVVAATHVQPPSLRLKNNIAPRVAGVTNAIIRKKQEEQVKAVAQLANGLRKRKQELLQSYVKQVKSALELVERCEQSDPQRAKTLDTIKVLQTTIDKLRKEIAAEQEQMHAQIQNQQSTPVIPLKKTKEQQKKELLDIELELFAQQQEGNDTTAIQKRLEELQRNLGIVPSSASSTATLPTTGNLSTKSSHYIASGRANARLRTAYPDGSTRVDRRPKTIIVTGFIKEEADAVLAHLKHFGEITKHDMDLEKPQLIVSYATRTNAEQAFSRGKVYKDKCLQIIWAPIVPASSAVTSGPVVANADNKAITSTNQDEQQIQQPQHEQDQEQQEQQLQMESAETESIKESNATDTDVLPELRLEDEEEEEESEDRSWRR